MPVLVLSVYDLGRPPMEAHALAVACMGRGHEVQLRDLAVQEWPTEDVRAADVTVICVPMHTATRLGVAAAGRVRAENPGTRIAAVGLYAHLAGPVLERSVDTTFGPDEIAALLAWVDGLVGADRSSAVDGFGAGPGSTESATAVVTLPDLDRYARLELPGSCTSVLAGAVAASTGCIHRCRHCPVPVAYDGRVRLTAVDAVMESIDAQVERGAGHISFADPDFLNSRGHARRVVAAFTRRHPGLTFDCTVKVEHIVAHPEIWPEMRAAGCLFVISAVECVDDEVLRVLDKGHTAAEAARAVAILRSASIEIRPSLLPFTPWTTPDSLIALFDFVYDNALVHNVDPVHYSIRLLVPHGSLLQHHPAMAASLGPYDEEMMAFSWTFIHPELASLQQRLAVLAERSSADDHDLATTYLLMRAELFEVLGRLDVRAGAIHAALSGSTNTVPRMTESWFCCAEPTSAQLNAIAANSSGTANSSGPACGPSGTANSSGTACGPSGTACGPSGTGQQ